MMNEEFSQYSIH